MSKLTTVTDSKGKKHQVNADMVRLIKEGKTKALKGFSVK